MEVILPAGKQRGCRNLGGGSLEEALTDQATRLDLCKAGSRIKISRMLSSPVQERDEARGFEDVADIEELGW